MVFSADQNMMKIGGIDFDPETGEMTLAWTLDGATTALQALYGPKESGFWEPPAPRRAQRWRN